jgi:hypothetical protein
MRQGVRTAAVIVAGALVLAACGRLTDAGGGGDTGPTGPTGPGIDHPTGSDELVLRVEQQGGFVPFEYALTRVPSWSLYGDGRVIVEGPQIMIYPGPALPNLLVSRLTEEGVQAVLAAAREAGLMERDASYPNPCVTDAPTTVFTTTAEGHTTVVSADALGMGPGACPGVDDEARAKLETFWSKLTDLASWLPEGSVGPEEPYVAAEIRIYVRPYRGEPDLAQEPIAWPLETPLADFGEPFEGGERTRCGVVSGADLETLLPLLERANQLTPWESEGRRYGLLLRPLLPDEHGC